MTRQGTDTVFNTFRDLGQSLPWLDSFLRPLSDLPMDFSALPVFLQEIIVHSVKMTLFFAGGPKTVFTTVIANLAFGVFAVGEKGRDCESWGARLRLVCAFLLL